MATYSRQTAIPCTLAELRDGAWVQQEEMPSGIKTSRGLLSRVNVYGVLVDIRENGFVLDDGTHQLQARSFDENPIRADVGDLVLVVGRPREYNGERYLVYEICKKLKNKEWIVYRKKELAQLLKVPITHEQQAPKIPEIVEVEATDENPFEKMMNTIRELDDGQGAAVDEVLNKVPFPDKEKLLNTLLEEGEIFEMRPGKVKVLE